MKKYVLAILMVSALAAGLAWSAEEDNEYYAVLMDGKKIGHMVQTRKVTPSKVTTTQIINMTLGRGASAITADMINITTETTEGKPLSFDYTQKASGISMKTAGKITPNGRLNLTISGMGMNQKKELDWPKDALLTEGLRLLQVEKGLAKGTTYEAVVFDPAMLAMAATAEQAAIKAIVNVGDTANVDLFGRVVQLAEVKVAMQMGAQTIDTTSYVDTEFRALKTIVPMMGMTLEMIACDKQFAMSENDMIDFLDKLFIQSPVELKEVKKCESVTYELSAKEGKTLGIPSDDNQKVDVSNGKIILTVKPITAPAGGTLPYKGQDKEILKALQPTPYVQCDIKEIQDMAKQAVGGTTDPAEAIMRIESFVKGYITTKDLSVGYASAAEVAKSRVGDCTEHSVLTAALCRAAGIPAKVVFGVVYVDTFADRKAVFGGHAWTEACVGGKWIGLDSTRAPAGFGPGHIKLAEGEGDPEQFFAMVNTLGYFTIDKVTCNLRQKAPSDG